MNTCLLYIVDDIYLLYCLYSLRSFRKIYPNIDVYIVSSNFKSIRQLNDNEYYKIKNIYFYKVEKFYKENVIKRIKRYRISQLKWFIPQFSFFYKYDRVLYCDSDIIFHQNIDGFFNIDFDNHSVVGVDDTIYRNNDFNNYKIVRDYKYNFQKYVNSGVLLFDTSKFNVEKSILISDKCIKTYNSLNLNMFDQDMFNLYFDIKCIYDYRYNYASYYLKNKIKDIKIEHLLHKPDLITTIINDWI